MRRIVCTVVGVLAVSTGAFAQTPADLEIALLAAPANLREGATVIKWKPDFTYDTLRKGTNRLVCMDRSGHPSQQPFMSECTSIANLERMAQNLKVEVETDRMKRQAAFDALEASGMRVKPEYGSVWSHVMGKDRASARPHMTIAVPGATTQSTGLPDNPKQGGVWIMNAGTTTAHLMTPGE
jgi:hypothetical protein